VGGIEDIGEIQEAEDVGGIGDIGEI